MSQQQHLQPTINNRLHALPSSLDEPTIPEALQNVVLQHQVCYEVWPEWSRCGGRPRRIGYCVNICGVNDGIDCVPGHHVPGCPHCGSTYDRLHKIAQWMTREEQPGSRFEIQPFDRMWHIGPGHRSSRNEIIVTVKILHRGYVDAPLDDRQESCLNEVRAKLKKLGVQEDVWRVGT